MWNDDIEFPSVEDTPEGDFEIPEGDLDWVDGWERNTIHRQLFELSQFVRQEWESRT